MEPLRHAITRMPIWSEAVHSITQHSDMLERRDAPSFERRSDREILLGLPDWNVAAFRSSTGVAAGSSATCATLGSSRPTVSAKRPSVYSAGLGGSTGCDAAASLLLVLPFLLLADAPPWLVALLLLVLAAAPEVPEAVQ